MIHVKVTATDDGIPNLSVTDTFLISIAAAPVPPPPPEPPAPPDPPPDPGEGSDSDAGDDSSSDTSSDTGGDDGADGITGEPAAAGNTSSVTNNSVDAQQNNTNSRGILDFEEQLPSMTGDELGSKIANLAFDDNVIMDELQPLEIKATWSTLLNTFAGSEYELSAYLQSAFRMVAESAVLFKEAHILIETVTPIVDTISPHYDINGLIHEVNENQQDVRVAVDELQMAIKTIEATGRMNRFDRVFDDVVEAMVLNLKDANEQLIISTSSLNAALLAVNRDMGNDISINRSKIEQAVNEARAQARHEIDLMRKQWDMVAKDVFAAFVKRLLTDQKSEG